MTKLKKLGKILLIALAVLLGLILLTYLLLCGKGGSYYNEDGSYKHVSASHSFRYIMNHPALGELGENALPLGGKALRTVTSPWKLKIMIPFLGKHEPTVVGGINYTIDMAEAGRTDYVPIYSESEMAANPTKEKAGLFIYRAEDENAPFVVVVPGGGFTMLGVASSAWPYAEPLVEAGYNVFVLKYRVGVYEGETDKIPASHRAAEDMAAALACIRSNADAFGIDPDKYLLVGSSAGGQIAARFCAETAFDDTLPAPAASLLLYPANCERYDYTGCTVPMYITVCQDDPQINVAGLDQAVAAMEAAGLTVSYNKFETGGHSFGLGVGTPAEGWMDRALAFAEAYIS